MVHAFFGGALMLVVSALVFVLFYPLLVTMLGGADIGDVETIKKLSKNVPVAGRLISIMLDYAAVGIRYVLRGVRITIPKHQRCKFP